MIKPKGKIFAWILGILASLLIASAITTYQETSTVSRIRKWKKIK